MSLQLDYTNPARRQAGKYNFIGSIDSPSSGSLIPTRSNTPDNEKGSSSDNFSDKDPIYDRHDSANSMTSTDYDGNALFEIDVKPKRKNFVTVEERRLFVEDYKRKYKTEMCKNWELKGRCKFGDKCCFAHGRHELKAKVLTHIKYKTKPCKQYLQTGYCPYGQRCQYLHKEAISPNVFCIPSEGRFKYNPELYDILHEVNKLSMTDCGLEMMLEKMPERPRLSVFQKYIEAGV